MTRLSAFGDSVLRGVVLENNKYKFSKVCFVNILTDELGADIKNKGKFGSTVTVGEQMIERNIEHIKESSSRYVVTEFGGNDCDFDWKAVAEAPNAPHMPKTDIKAFAEGYTRILNRIKELGKQPVILSLPPIDSERFFDRVSEGLSRENILKFLDGNKRHISDWHERYNLETFKIAAANNVPIIDITSKFLECSNYSDYLCDDGIHPNEKGHRLIADTIREYIKEKRVEL